MNHGLVLVRSILKNSKRKRGLRAGADKWLLTRENLTCRFPETPSGNLKAIFMLFL